MIESQMEKLFDVPKFEVNILPNVQEMIIQLIVTFIAVYLIRRKFYDVIKNYFKKQNEFVKNKVSNALDQEKEAQKLKEEQQQLIQKTNQKYQAALSDAKKEAQTIKEQIINEASNQAEVIKQQKIQQVENSINEAKTKLSAETVNIANQLLDKLINENQAKIDEKLKSEMIDKIV